MRYLLPRRVWIDEKTHEVLDNLMVASAGLTIRDQLFDAIIYEWINTGGRVRINNINYAENFVPESFILFNVTDNRWNDFRTLCTIKRLNTNIGMKIAIMSFVDLVVTDSINILEYFFSF